MRNLISCKKILVVVSLQGEHICCSNPQPPTMFFDTIESRLSGSTGCNRYFAQYQMTDSTVQFTVKALHVWRVILAQLML